MVNVPTVEWREWTTTIDPSGIRISDDTTTLDASGFLGNRSTIAGETLVFDPVNIAVSGQTSDTKVLTAYITNWGDGSGISNMKFFLTSVSDFGVGDYRFLYSIRTHWASGLELNETDSELPITIPTSQNILSTFGSGTVQNTGYYDESQVLQYVYLSMFIGVDVPVGVYGSAGGGGFRMRLLYEFS
jgi:hypothetical protein